jgi:hypothetical protein
VTDDTLERAIDELRFDDAEALAASDEEHHRLSDARAAAIERALALQVEMVELGRAADHRRILEIDAEPGTERLLALISPAARDRADLQVRLAKRWQTEQRATAHRRMLEARKALDGLDFTLARGLLQKVDGELLDDADKIERDNMLLELSARAMEMEELAEKAARIVADTRPPERKRRWFRRG